MAEYGFFLFLFSFCCSRCSWTTWTTFVAVYTMWRMWADARLLLSIQCGVCELVRPSMCARVVASMVASTVASVVEQRHVIYKPFIVQRLCLWVRKGNYRAPPRPHAPRGVAAFMPAHSKTPYITPSMDVPSGNGVVRGRMGAAAGIILYNMYIILFT